MTHSLVPSVNETSAQDIALHDLHDACMQTSPTPDGQPLFWRASTVARILGVPHRMLLADLQAGRLPVPVRMAYFGASGIAHVNRQDALALVQRLAQPETQR